MNPATPALFAAATVLAGCSHICLSKAEEASTGKPTGSAPQAATDWRWRQETRLANPGAAGFRCAAVFQDKLFLGTDHDREPWNAGVYVFDGQTWTLSTNFSGGREAVVALSVFQNKLKAGVEERGEVWGFDGNTWQVSLDSDGNWPLGLAVWRGKLWASIASRQGNRLHSFDGHKWRDEGEHERGTVGFALAVFGDRLHLGLSGSDYYNRRSTAGRVLSFDGKERAAAFAPAASRVQQLAAHGGRLFAGVFPDGKIYQFDGKAWTLSYDTPDDAIMAFAPFSVTGGLYAGGEAAEGTAPGLHEWTGQAWRTLRTFAQANGRGVVPQEFRGRLYAALGNGEVWSGAPAGLDKEKLSDTFGVHPLFPRQFVYRRQPFFFIGKSAFALIDADWRGFVDEADRDGFTVLRVWLCCPSLTRKHGKDHFQRNQAAGDVWPFGGTPAKPDFTRFDQEYFRRLDALLDYMESKGMVAELTLFTGGDFWPGGPLAWDELKQRYVQFVLDRYRDRPNLYYEIANEYYSAEQQAFVDKVGDFIWARDRAHLVTASAGDLARFAGKPWYRLHNFHPSRGRNWWTRVYDEVLLPARHVRLPLVNDEPMGSRAADDKEHGYPGRDTDAAHHRMNFWVTVLGGGHVTFHSHKGINALPGPGPGQEFVKPLREFIAHVRFWELEPAPERLKSGIAYLATSADELVAYLPAGSEATLDLRPLDGPLTARWFNPRDGRFGESFAVPDGQPHGFKPSSEGDWALHLQKAKKP